MVKRLLPAFLLTFILSANIYGQCGNLYIGGVIDGPLSGGTPKGVQICASGDVADLSIYGIGSANNGGGSDGEEFTFPVMTVSSGDCFWVGSSTDNWMTFFGFEPCYTAGATNINGDDAIELFCSGFVEDLFGDIDVDGNGECWEYMDGWAVNSTGAPNLGAFDCDDWSFSGPGALNDETSNALATTPYPSPAQTCPEALPITLESFTGELRNKTVELSWSTSVEVNNNYFEILKSTDGVSFEAVGRVEGAGNSNRRNDYTFIDGRPASGMNYYRLKQVDLDGRSESFHIVKIENKSDRVKIYPTHIVSTLNIEIEDVESSSLIIFNSVGETQKIVSLNSAFNSVDISELPSGIYFAKVESNNQTTIEKIIRL